MSNNQTLEQRLATLEQTVAELKLQIGASASSNWLDKVIGSISDEPAFLEALEYGRLIRHADETTDIFASRVTEPPFNLILPNTDKSTQEVKHE